MLKSRTKEIILCVITIITLALVTTTVFAASDINELLNDANNTKNQIPQISNKTNNTVNNTDNNTDNNTANNTANNKANNTSTRNKTANNSNSTMPNTGVDYSIVFIIAICGISTIYAYKKIRDYNNI